MNREPHNSCSSFAGQHGGGKSFKQGTKPTKQSGWPLFPTPVPVSGRHVTSQPRRCDTPYKVQEPRGKKPRLRGGGGWRGAFTCLFL